MHSANYPNYHSYLTELQKELKEAVISKELKTSKAKKQHFSAVIDEIKITDPANLDQYLALYKAIFRATYK